MLTTTGNLHPPRFVSPGFPVKIVLIICFILTFLWAGSAQATVHRTENFLQRLSSTEGLSNNRAFKTLQDKKGYVWIATETGLNRYDGYQVQHIGGPDDVFSREFISTLFLDNDGFLWIPTYSSGIFRMDPNTFETTHFQQRSKMEGSPIFTGIASFIQAAPNEVLIAGDNKVQSVNTQSNQLKTLFTTTEPHAYVRTLLLRNQMLYIGTSVGLYRLNLNTMASHKLNLGAEEVGNPDKYNVKTLFYEPGTGLIVGSVKGLYQITDEQLQQPNTQRIAATVLHESFNIWDIDKVKSRYYLATDQGLFLFDFNSKQADFVLKFSNSRYYTSDNNILDVYVDSNHTFWMASRTQGVLRWSENITNFHHVTQSTQPALSQEFVEPLYQDNNNHLWIGTRNGLNRYNIETNTITHYLNTDKHLAVLGNQMIRFIFPDSQHNDRLWIGTIMGLFSFNKNSGELTVPKMTPEARRIMQSQWIYSMYLRDNETLFMINNKGHFQFNPVSGEIKLLKGLNQKIDVVSPRAFLGFLPNRPQEIIVASRKHIWLYHLQNETLRVIYNIDNTIPNSGFHVTPGKTDSNNVLWFAISGEGVIGLNAQTFDIAYQFKNDTQLTDAYLHSLEIDQFNHIWIGSTDGLFRLHSSRKHAEHYMVEDGLITPEFSRSSSLTLNNQQLAFGTHMGLTIFNPASFAAPPPERLNAQIQHMDYQVYLSEARILQRNGETQKQRTFTNQTITLGHDQPGLYLHYSTLDFQQQSRTVYHIEMQGPTKVQLPGYMSNKLLLPQLEAGKHQLTISAHHPLYGLESPPLTVTINVEHWPWVSPLAKSLYGVLLCCIVLMIALYRRSRAREFQQLHGKLKDSLNRMQMALESNKSGIWEYHCENDRLYSERLTDDLGFTNISNAPPIATHLKLINPEHRKQFTQSWQTFLNRNQNDWQFTYQMTTTDGQYLWYSDVGKVVERDSQGKPVRISGIYTNITERKASEERSRVFGQAFCQINDWVLILDNKLRPVTANNALTDMLNQYNQNNLPLLQQLINRVGVKHARRYSKIMLSLNQNEHWQGEDCLALQKPYNTGKPVNDDQAVTTGDNTSIPVSVKIHAIGSDSEKICHYVLIISDITVQKAAEQKLRYMAHYDFLTNLPNRKLMLEKISKRIEWNRGQFAVLFIDLNKFKQVNDLYGHYVGDKLLRRVARILSDNVDCNDFVARQSGDEFIILLNSFETSNDISLIAKSIITTLSRPVVIDDLHVNVTASIGIALYPDDANEADDIISKADMAMIHAKRQVQGDYQFFTQDMDEEALARMTLENDLKRAVITNEFQNYYQPIVNSRTNTMMGAELLLRWSNAGKFISPNVFIPICEEIGIISQITINAIDRALLDYKKWFSGHKNFYISVNLSPVHILQEGLKDTLLQLLEKHQSDVSLLRLEITESTLLSDVETALRRLEELRAHGFKLMLDDFGTGYSSMGYLNKFSIDYIKIDKSFVLNLENKTSRSIIRSVVTLANNLSLQCIVEGVETQQQREYAESLGCHLLQGFYYSKAVPAPEIVNLTVFKQAVH